jgi:hypothetical protein
MPNDMAVLELSVRDAVVEGYSEIERLRSEINHWWMRRGPKLGPDNTIISMRVRELCRNLEAIKAPDVALIPDEVADCQVRARLCVGSHSRSARCENAEAKLQLAVAALRKSGLGELAEKIREDTLRMPLVFPAVYDPA